MADSQVYIKQYEDDRRFENVDDDEYCEDCGEHADDCECGSEIVDDESEDDSI
jgi:hypothetical protein